MKSSSLIFLLITAGCSAPHFGKVAVTPRSTLIVPGDFTERVRYPELVKGYHVARYVDPNQRLLVHEAHTVYRVEAQATWDLHSGTRCQAPSVSALTNAAFSPAPMSDDIVAELTRQRQITKAVATSAN